MDIISIIITIGIFLFVGACVAVWIHFSTEAEYAAGAKLREIVDQRKMKNK